MMKVLACASTNQPISLVRQIANSGEGEIWQTHHHGYLAKVYYSPTPERIRKLEVMVAHPPKDPNAHINHISFAWPKSLLKDQKGNVVGFLMSAIANSVQLLDVYNPQRRQKVLPGFNWLYLHATALNIASIVWAIHKAGYVLGDIKPQNILVNNCALPAIIDTDSFQVVDPKNGQLYRCLVGSEGFTPPELLDRDLSSIEQTEVHDRFRLAVIIYQLLFGDHPFKGKWVGYGDSPDPNEILRRGFWPHAAKSLIQPGPLTMPLDIVHPEVQKSFLRCFNQGHTQPKLRPTAQEWFSVLKLATAELKACRKVKTHYYSQTYHKCYWCERKASLAVDIFPPRPNLVHSKINKVVRTSKIAIKNLKRKSPAKALLPAIKPRISVSKTASAAIVTVKQGMNKQPLAAPIDRQLIWWKLGTVIGGSVAVFALLIFLSSSQIDANEIGLTIAGIIPCFGLVGIGFLWMRAINKTT
jgi:DNA-binding helix-hairpin-helix protein with protein kinase domain